MIPGKLAVVLPAHNERENLPAVVTRALEVLPELTPAFELVVVDDGSQDGTGLAGDSLAARHPEVKIVHHAENRGYGAALTSGFAAANGDFIMFMDSDRQFDIADLSYLAPYVGTYDIVAGYRIHRQDARHRIIFAAIFKYAMRLLFGIRLRDIDCAFKVFRADLLQGSTLESPGALINTEILAKAGRAGATWVEVGVHHYPRPVGESSGGSPKVIFRAMHETLRLWRRMRHYHPCQESAPNPTSSVAALVLAVVAVFSLVVGISTRIARRKRS